MWKIGNLTIQDKFPKITKIALSFAETQLEAILNDPNVYYSQGHFEYPQSQRPDKIGNHLDSLILFEPIAANAEFLNWLVADLQLFIEQEKLDFDTIFAPAQKSVIKFVEILTKRLNVKAAYLEYLPTGWFGNKITEGKIGKGDKVLVLNGVSQQGRCVGLRLPELVKMYEGNVVGAAVFASGNGLGVQEACKTYGSKFYRSIECNLNVYNPANCPLCKDKTNELIAWTKYRDLVNV